MAKSHWPVHVFTDGGLFLSASLYLDEFCKSVLILCTDPAIRELQLSQRIFTWLDPSMEWPH